MSELASAPSLVQLKDHIDLTRDEEELFVLLLEVTNFSKTQLRVAGGWVRDKLIGVNCNDIDIAVDNMSGQEFCQQVDKYLSSELGEKPRGYHVIPRNPEKSKHLEATEMELLGMKVDFVNLREEDYCENSRIPTMRFATPEQDAYRRDLTINSLFYNIRTSLVEDFTGRGIEDLKYGRIVTPLPPKKTFLDDPLRVLRAIRFGARFGFVLDEELKKAAAVEDVRNAIMDKISRERIGKEIDLMLCGNQPVDAMTYITNFNLFWTVFCLPYDVEPSIPKGCERLCVAYLNSAWRLLHFIGRSSFSDDQFRLCMYAAFCMPFKETVYRRIPLVNYIFNDCLRLESRAAKEVISLHTAANKFVTLIPLLADIQVPCNRENDARVLPGLLLREIGESWRVALLLSMLLHPIDTVASTSALTNEDIDLDKRSGLFKTIENAISALGLEKVWMMQPLANGDEIMDFFQIKSGPVVGILKRNLMEWQLAHPSGTLIECFDWMKKNTLLAYEENRSKANSKFTSNGTKKKKENQKKKLKNRL